MMAAAEVSPPSPTISSPLVYKLQRFSSQTQAGNTSKAQGNCGKSAELEKVPHCAEL